MRVLHLATTYPLHVGDSNAVFVENLVEALAERGHDIEVVLPWHPDLELERPGRLARLHAFRYSPSARWHPWGYAQALTADRSLRWDAYIAAVTASLSAARTVRKLVRQSSIDLVHTHWLLPNGPISAVALGKDSCPNVISCHGSGVFLAERHRWAAAAARYALARAAGVTACSRDLATRASALGPGPEVEWIPYGVDSARFAPAAGSRREQVRARLADQHGLDAGAPWLFAVGRLVFKKGFDRLVAALPAIQRQASSTELVIAGEGPLHDDLLQQAGEAGVAGSLHLIGALPHETLADYYAAADIIAVPSVHGPAGNVDGLPNTFLEALASGTAVVASRVGGMPDVAEHGRTALLVEEGDVEALAVAVCDLLADPQRRRQVGSSAHDMARRELSWQHVAERFEKLYDVVRSG